jgi:hypothetical protein
MPGEQHFEAPDSEDFDDQAIDEFGDFIEDEASQSAHRTNSERSFAAIQRERMTDIQTRTIKNKNDDSAGYKPMRNQGNVKKYQRQEDTEEFVDGNFKKAQNEGMDDLEVPEENSAVEGEEGQQVFEIDDVRYTINTINGKQEIVDELGNRYIYHDGTGAVNTELRAAHRDQLKQERAEIERQEMESQKKLFEQRHKAKLDQIANKGKNRAFPYGLNYSEKKEEVEAGIRIAQPQYKKVTREILNKLIENKSIKDEYVRPTNTSRSRVKRVNIDIERLTKPKESHDCKQIHKVYNEQMTKNTSKMIQKSDEKRKIGPNYEKRMKFYENEKLHEIQSLQKQKSEDIAKQNQQFKACKGSEKIMKSLINKEKQYTAPVHERLYNNKQAKDKKIGEIIENVHKRDTVVPKETQNLTIKHTLDLSSSIDIRKRLGIEHLLPQKDYNKVAALKKLEEERKARIEFHEMVKSHKKQKRNTPLTSSHQKSSKNKSQTTTKNPTKKVQPQKPHKATPNNQSNKYLYKRL